MQIEHPFPWRRIAQTLEASPIIIGHLVHGISDTEADYRPDPQRLTIREIIPHLVGWESIIFGHLQRICQEDVPHLSDGDHEPLSKHSADILTQCTWFTESRTATVAFLKERTTADWARQAIRSTYGPTTLDAQVIMIAMHDTYHIRQIVEWRQLYAKSTSRGPEH